MTPREYLRRPYTRTLIPDQDTGTFTALIAEFPGCIAQGDSVDEAYARLEKAAEGWIEAALELGQSVPEPREESTYSGKLAVRMAKSLHRQAVEVAAAEGVSLNQLIVTALSERLGATKAFASMLSNFRSQVQASLQSPHLVLSGAFERRSAMTLNKVVIPAPAGTAVEQRSDNLRLYSADSPDEDCMRLAGLLHTLEKRPPHG